jgi:hypothetical protein
MNRNSPQSSRYVVTALSKDSNRILRSEIWETRKPMPIGYPIRWVLEKTASGVRLRTLDPHSQLKSGKLFEDFSEDKLKKSDYTIPLSNLNFKLHKIEPIDHHASSSWTPRFISLEPSPPLEDLNFKKASQASAIAFLVLGLILAVWPQRKPPAEEVIPPQFAKVLLSPAFKGSQEQARAKGGGSTSSESSNLVQALRSQTVQKSASRLVNKGALALLSRSNLLSGAAAKGTVSQIFDAKSKLDSSPLSQQSQNPLKSVALKTLGGKGENGAGLGYGQGGSASVSGQGSSFVSLDTKEAMVEEGLTADEVGRVIHSHLSEIRYCYESAMLRNPSVEGKVLVDFKIRSTGIVKSALVKDSTVSDSNLEQCVISHLLKWKFPKPKGGIEVAVSYPFLFKTLGK